MLNGRSKEKIESKKKKTKKKNTVCEPLTDSQRISAAAQLHYNFVFFIIIDIEHLTLWKKQSVKCILRAMIRNIFIIVNYYDYDLCYRKAIAR